MTPFRNLKAIAVMASAAFVAFACGGGGTSGGGVQGEIHIGVELPLSGTEGSQGQPILKGVQYSIQRAGGSVKGFTLKAVSYDDATNTAVLTPSAPLTKSTLYTATLTRGIRGSDGSPGTVPGFPAERRGIAP